MDADEGEGHQGEEGLLTDGDHLKDGDLLDVVVHQDEDLQENALLRDGDLQKDEDHQENTSCYLEYPYFELMDNWSKDAVAVGNSQDEMDDMDFADVEMETMPRVQRGLLVQ